MLATTIGMSIPPAWHLAGQARNRDLYSSEIGIRSFRYESGNALTTSGKQNSIEALGWSKAEALETYLRLRTFAADWDYPGMEAYDHRAGKDAVIENHRPKTALGQKLIALRRAYVEKGGQLLDAEALDAELRMRRGGIADA